MIIKRPVFKSYILLCQALAADRDGRPDQWSVDRTGRPMCTRRAQRPVVWPVDRAVDRLKSAHSRVGPVDRRSTGQRAVALWFWARSTGQSTGRLNGQFFDRWLVDRSVDRKVNFDLVSCQWAEFLWGLFIPHLKLVFTKNIKS